VETAAGEFPKACGKGALNPDICGGMAVATLAGSVQFE
jgi:hypothetical protein